jgi:hypothetical protein
MRHMRFAVREIERLHHLSYETIAEHNGWIAISVGQLERQLRQFRHLLHRSGRKH